MYYLYILKCINGSYYTGYTTDIQRRYAEHCQGSIKCKYTRSFPPQKLAIYWQLDASLSNVLKMEHMIKKLTKQEKVILIKKPDTLLTQFMKKKPHAIINMDAVIHYSNTVVNGEAKARTE